MHFSSKWKLPLQNTLKIGHGHKEKPKLKGYVVFISKELSSSVHTPNYVLPKQ